MRRHLRGEAGRRRWSARTIRRGREGIMRRWRTLLTRLAARHPTDTAGQLDKFLSDKSFFYSQVAATTDLELAVIVESMLEAVKAAAHGRTRQEQRKAIAKHIQQREDSREGGKLRAVLASMLGPHRKRRDGFLLESVRLGDATLVHPWTVHQTLTDVFQKWMATPDTARGIRTTHGEWDLFDLTEEQFLQAAQCDCVPSHVMSAIHRSVDLREPIDITLLDTPTLKEFTDAIAHLKRDSAPGVTGLSYNMIKEWPEDVVSEAYNSLALLWEQRRIPDEWTRRWIVPIPKKSDPDVTDLRPLMLLEAMRKAWCSIISNRIQTFWAQHHSLQRNQFGSVRGKGTEGAIAAFLNAAETAKETCSPILMTSWDIKRAFDSVSKPVIRLALTRLGIPNELADYVVALDQGGETIVRTPYALKQLRDHGRCHSLGFDAERGIGQGDVLSPLIWTAVFDLLLTSLSQVQHGAIFTSDRHGKLEAVQDIAYADDLLSLQGDIQSLQTKADLVSGFCIFAGLTLATDKFRAFAVNWGNEHVDVGTVITLHTEGWLPTIVRLQHDGTFKHLGILWDMHLSNEQQRTHTLGYLKTALAYVCAKRASNTCKYLAITKCIIPKIIYTAKFMSWTLQQYEELEQPISAAYRKIAKHLPGFPTALLYVERSDGGMGFTSLSDAVQQAKLALHQRLSATPDGCHVASSLFARAFAMRGQGLLVNIRARLWHTDWSSTVWATSLIQWMEGHGYWLEATGSPTDAASSSHAMQVDLTDWTKIAHEGLHTCAEITQEDSEVRLRAGQCWTDEDNAKHGKVFEIINLSEGEIQGTVWDTADGAPVITGSRLWTRPVRYGAGNDPSLHVGLPQDFVASLRTPRLVVTTRYKHLYRQGTARNEITVTGLRPKQICPMMLTKPIDVVSWEDNVTIYTDGSFSAEGTLAQWSKGTQPKREAAAVVVRGESDLLFRMTEGVALHSAHAAETLALAIGMRGARGHAIYSDCAAAIAAWGGRVKYTGVRGMNLLACGGYGDVRKVKAHAEKTTAKENWTDEQHGNVTADAVAAGDEAAAGGEIREVSADAMKEMLTDITPFLWVDEEDRAVFVPRETRRKRDYLRTRDHTRANDTSPRPARWEDTTCCLAAKMWSEHGKKGTGSWAQAVRIMWDKHMTGENEGKWNMEVTQKCVLCGVPTSQKHMIVDCQRPGMSDIRATAIKQLQQEANKHGMNIIARTLRTVVSLMSHPDAYTLWTGMWTKEIRDEMAARCPWHLKGREYGQVVAALRHLANATLALYGIAQGQAIPRRRGRRPIERRTQSKLQDLWRMEDTSSEEEQPLGDAEDSRHNCSHGYTLCILTECARVYCVSPYVC